MEIWNHNGEPNKKNPIGPHFSGRVGSTPYLEGNMAYAVIIDEQVVETSVANSGYWSILESNFSVIDVTSEYPDVDPDKAYVLKFMIGPVKRLVVGVLKRYGAIMLSNPTIVKLDNYDLHRDVQVGWEYRDGVFVCPPDFDPYSEELI